MKNIILILLLASCVSLAKAQQPSGDVKLISSGGGLVIGSGNGYSGSTTIGLPFVGIIDNSTTKYDSKIGLYGKPDSVTTWGVSNILDNASESFIYPNPTTGAANLTLPASMGKILQIDLIDISGKKLESLPYTISDQAAHVNIGTKPNGTYLLTVVGKNSVIKYKVTLQK